jgi:hypothetical protein
MVVYVKESLLRGKWTTSLFNHGLIVLLWRTEWIWNTSHDTNYPYELKTTFKVAPDVVHGSLEHHQRYQTR